MLRTILIPDKQNISINLPSHFLGKRVELLAFVLDESRIGEEIELPNSISFASEPTLAKDWLTIEEDQAWKDL